MNLRRIVALATVVLTVGAVGAQAAPSKTPAAYAVPTKRPPDRERGRDLYLQSCWQCHGTEGKGDGPAAIALPGGVPTLAGKVSKAEIETLVDVVEDGRGRMPAFREDIDKHDAKRILQYLEDAIAGHPEARSEKDEAEDDGGNQN